jgi:hypothetical protein
MQAFYRQCELAVFFACITAKKKASRGVSARGACLVGDYLRSLVVPFMAKICSKKTRK